MCKWSFTKALQVHHHGPDNANGRKCYQRSDSFIPDMFLLLSCGTWTYGSKNLLLRIHSLLVSGFGQWMSCNKHASKPKKSLFKAIARNLPWEHLKTFEMFCVEACAEALCPGFGCIAVRSMPGIMLLMEILHAWFINIVNPTKMHKIIGPDMEH